MAFQYDQVLQHQYERIEIAHAQALAELEAGRVSEDVDRINAASDRILDLDKTRAALDQRTSQYVASRQSQPQRPFGLSDEQVEIAINSHSHGTREDRIAEYARNTQRYRALRASGYRDELDAQAKR